MENILKNIKENQEDLESILINTNEISDEDKKKLLDSLEKEKNSTQKLEEFYKNRQKVTE